MRGRGWSLLLLELGLASSIPLLAHHGNASYDYAATKTVIGIVTEWTWSNPHCLLKVNSKDEKGNVTPWILETNSPVDLLRTGWTAASVKPGDEVTVDVIPTKNGTPAGRIERIVLADGTVLSTNPLAVKFIRDGVYWTEGGVGGNTGFVVGKDGVIVFDAKMTPNSAKEMIAAIEKITPKRVTHVILSHSDGDHVNGLSGFPEGVTIIAQENCKREMEESKDSRTPAPQDYLPTKTFDKNLDLTIDGVRVQLRHWVPAHTSGDLIMLLPDERIVFGGDLIDPTQFALVHTQKGGSTEGWITSMQDIIALDADTFVSGHGDLQTKSALRARLSAVEARRQKIKEMIASGKSLEEIKKTAPPEEPPTGPFGSPGFTEVVYNEFAKHPN
jgi:cyclase